jgi:hypothetical protein
MMIESNTLKALEARWKSLNPILDERRRRLWAGAEANALGYGGASAVARATGLALNTVRAGMVEAELAAKRKGRAQEPAHEQQRQRRTGAGRKAITDAWPGFDEKLARLVDSSTRGDPMSPLRWSSKSTAKLARAMSRGNRTVSRHTVAAHLQAMDYSLQSNRKRFEGMSHPDRDRQFRYIARQVAAFQERGQPVVSVDTKKKELLGKFKNGGREWTKKGHPTEVEAYDFRGPGGKAVPFGIYDVSDNKGWVNVGIDHDTASFAVSSIRQWWLRMGKRRYATATELLMTADCGGSNGNRVRLWKRELQSFASETGLAITVCHFPPGTSKWNKIEHRMFCHISANWRARPLTGLGVIISLIGSTTTQAGLKIRAAADLRTYPLKVKVSDEEMCAILMTRHKFHGEWNYTIQPRPGS